MHEEDSLVVLLRLVFIIIAHHNFEFRDDSRFTVSVTTDKRNLLFVNFELFLEFLVKYGATLLTFMGQN